MELIKTYQTEKSIALGLLLWGVVLFTFVMALLYGESLMQKIIMGLAVALVSVVWFGTKYFIKGGFLVVKIGPITHTKLDIGTIKSITSGKRNLMASPANSFDRIALQYGKFDELLISPKNRKYFIEDLLKINPNIKIEASLL